MSIQRSWWQILHTLPPLLAVVSVLLATMHGVGISPDSVAYVGVARNLLAGHGLSLPFGPTLDAPLTHFPPLYSLLLAMIGTLEIEVVEGARWLQALLAGYLVWIAGRLLHRYSGDQLGLYVAIVGATLLAFSPTLLGIAVMAWTETLFLALSLSAIFLLARFLEGWQWPTLLGAALLVGATLLTRYAGLALVATGAVALLLFAARPLWQRIFASSIFVLVGLSPLVVWLLRNMMLTGNATNRTLAYHPLGIAQLAQALDTAASWWLIPANMPAVVKVAIAALPLLLIAVALCLPRNGTGESTAEVHTTVASQPRMMHILALYAITYALFLLVSISLIDANTPLDARILSPLHLTILLLTLLAVVSVLTTFAPPPPLRAAIGVASVVLALLMLRQSSQLVQGYARDGIGLAAVAWQSSELITAAQELPADQLLYTNAPEALYHLTGRSALSIPRRVNVMAQTTNATYAAELETMRQRLASGGHLIYFTKLGRSSLAQQQELQAELGLVLVVEVDDGALYQMASSKAATSPN
jgi:hypothetical protein